MNYKSINFIQQDHDNISDLFDYNNLTEKKWQKALNNFEKLLDFNEASRYLYIIRCCPSNYYKIGITNNIKKRIKTHQTGCPFELKFTIIVEADMEDFLGREIIYLEKILHKNYEHLKLRGEWFNLSDKHLSDICFFLQENRDLSVTHDEPKELKMHLEIVEKIIAEDLM